MSGSKSNYPYVVYIIDTIGGQTFQGSGVLITPDEVLTASHVVYSSVYGPATSLTVYPGYNSGSAPYGSATETTADIHYGNIQDANGLISAQSSEIDYAVIHLTESFTGLGTMLLDPNFPGGAVNVTGYPGWQQTGVQETIQDTASLEPGLSLFSAVGLGDGSSGGPMWITGNNNLPEVVGTVSSGPIDGGAGGNFPQITTTEFNQIEAWLASDQKVFGTSPTAGAPPPPQGPMVSGLPSYGLGYAMIDTGTIAPFAHVSVSDPGINETETLLVGMSAGPNGNLIATQGGTVRPGVYGPEFIVIGSPAAVTSALDGMEFTPTPYAGAAGTTQTVRLFININDTSGLGYVTAPDAGAGIVVTETAPAVLSTVANFNGPDGASPEASLIMDAKGDLFGTADMGGTTPSGLSQPYGFGTVFEIATSSTGYASTPTALDLFNFNNPPEGASPGGSLVMDHAGDLFGTTTGGGDPPGDYGTVYEIANTATGYASTPTTLAAFDFTDGASPFGGLIVDAYGDLFGTTVNGGPDNDGTVFEIVKTGTTYASSISTLATFSGTDGANPYGTLLADANGDLFGTTNGGGEYVNPNTSYGTVFEIFKTSYGYASSPIPLVVFNNADGAFPEGNLVADTKGDLFGMTYGGGAYGQGTVFEIAKTASGFASTPTTLVSLNFPAGVSDNNGGLTIDPNGDLFGTSIGGDNSYDGAVFEVANTSTGYATTVTTVVSFDGANGDEPNGGLVAGANGTLYGTTKAGGTSGFGTVFAIKNAGYQTSSSSVLTSVVPGIIAPAPPTITGTVAEQTATDQTTIAPFANVVIGDGNAGQIETVSVTLSAVANGTFVNLDGGDYVAATGVYTDTGSATEVTAALDGLLFAPTSRQVVLGQTVTTGFTISDVDTLGGTASDSTPSVIATATPTLITLVNPATTSGFGSNAPLIVDAAGDLFGETPSAGVNGDGTVFELANSGTGYAAAPATLATFDLPEGQFPQGGLIADAEGDLFGTAQNGGANDWGTVFEIGHTSTGYVSTPEVLTSFNFTDGAQPRAGLISDSAGDLFGSTVNGGLDPNDIQTLSGVEVGDGTVFEIANTGTGYASTPTDLNLSTGSDGFGALASLAMDANGDLFGTTPGGGDGGGTVFEIAHTATGYADSPTNLITFTGTAEGSFPESGLIIDAAGDLFGTTQFGGADGDGTVFEVVHFASGYASVPVTLADFDGTDGSDPNGNLLADAAGNLFGTTNAGGTGGGPGFGTVFELANSNTGYASAVTTLVSFDGVAESFPEAGLTADAAGDLFGTAGSVFELTNTGFQAPVRPTISGTQAGQSITDQTAVGPFSKVTISDGNVSQIETVTVIMSLAANGSFSNLSGGAYNAANGTYTVSGAAAAVTAALDGLIFTPTSLGVSPGQTVTTGFTIFDIDTAEASASDSTTTVVAAALAPRVLDWTGGAGTGFGNPLNWSDTTFAPGAIDTVVFNSSVGGITGIGTVLAVDVGSGGAGVLQLSGGATLVTGSLDAGVAASDVAQVGLTGVGTSLTVTGDAIVAGDGSGVMSVLSGATFSSTNLTIGNQGDSSGAVVISGNGSVVDISGDLNVGTALGTGDLTIGPGGVVNARVVSLEGQVVLENGELDPTVNLINQGQTAGGSGTIAAGDIVDEGVIQAGGSKPSQKLLVVNGTVLGGGPWTINGTSQAQANGGAGILQINAGGTLEMNGAVLNAASTTFTDDVTPQSTYTVTNSVVDVSFADATGVLKLDQIAGFAGTIATFQKGDSIVITGGTLSNLGVTGGNTLTVSDSGHGGTDNIIFASGVSAGGFNIVGGNTIQVACFAAGTRIAVEKGCVSVEHLNAGDRVVTADGRIEPIVWIGHRTVNCRAHPEPETVWPVRIAAGAFDENVPIRDLYLSPDHAVFVNEVLIPVKLLVNGSSIAQVKRSVVTYYHVELPRHEVILAEALPVESYLDLGDRANFMRGAGSIRLFIDLAARLAPDVAAEWEARGAAPLVMAGEKLAIARRLTETREWRGHG